MKSRGIPRNIDYQQCSRQRSLFHLLISLPNIPLYHMVCKLFDRFILMLLSVNKRRDYNCNFAFHWARWNFKFFFRNLTHLFFSISITQIWIWCFFAVNFNVSSPGAVLWFTRFFLNFFLYHIKLSLFCIIKERAHEHFGLKVTGTRPQIITREKDLGIRQRKGSLTEPVGILTESS